METKTLNDVAIILVGLNARDYIKGCLTSLAQAEWKNCRYEIIYVDNASTDDSVKMVQSEFSHVKVLVNSTNVGFCPAANQGSREANSRYYYFINDDTEVIDDAIALLVEYMDEHPEAGTVGSRLLYPDGSEQWSGRRFPSMMNAILGRRSPLSKLFPNLSIVKRYLCTEELKKGIPFEVDWVSAAGQIVHKETFEAVGGYAEDYYYWHEAVFCDRISQQGKKILLHPKSKVIHYEGKGSGQRPYKIQKFHIKNFHHGAYRCYCEHYKLGKLNPVRLFTAVTLATRAALLLLICRIRTLKAQSR